MLRPQPQKRFSVIAPGLGESPAFGQARNPFEAPVPQRQVERCYRCRHLGVHDDHGEFLPALGLALPDTLGSPLQPQGDQATEHQADSDYLDHPLSVSRRLIAVEPDAAPFSQS